MYPVCTAPTFHSTESLPSKSTPLSIAATSSSMYSSPDPPQKKTGDVRRKENIGSVVLPPFQHPYTQPPPPLPLASLLRPSCPRSRDHKKHCTRKTQTRERGRRQRHSLSITHLPHPPALLLSRRSLYRYVRGSMAGLRFRLTLFLHHHLELINADRAVVVGIDLSERIAQVPCRRR